MLHFIRIYVVQTKEWVSVYTIISKQNMKNETVRLPLCTTMIDLVYPVPSLQVRYIVPLSFNSLVEVHYFGRNNTELHLNTCTRVSNCPFFALLGLENVFRYGRAGDINGAGGAASAFTVTFQVTSQCENTHAFLYSQFVRLPCLPVHNSRSSTLHPRSLSAALPTSPQS